MSIRSSSCRFHHRSQPTIAEWFSILFAEEKVSISSFPELLTATGLSANTPNPGGELDETTHNRLRTHLPQAVEAARQHMKNLRQQRAEVLARPLREGLGKVKVWKELSLAQIEKKKQALTAQGRKLRKDQRRRLEDQQRGIEKVYEERKAWINEGMRTVPAPYLRLAAVFIAMENR